MTIRPWQKTVALLNFGLGITGLVWLACNRPEAASPRPAATTNTAPAKAPTPASPPATLTSLAEVTACLDAGGGVIGARCVKPANVRGLERGGALNDDYFPASKAGSLVQWATPSDAVGELVEQCRFGVDAPSQAQAPVRRVATSAEVLACVRNQIENRTSRP